MGMFDELEHQGAARCAKGHALDVLQTKSLQDWSSLARFRIINGRLSMGAREYDFTGEANFYTHCERCPGKSSEGLWCEWVLTFEAGRLVWARTVSSGLPWGMPDPVVELSEAIKALRPFGAEKVLVAVDMLLEGLQP